MEGSTSNINNDNNNKKSVININENAKNGQTKCPKCGSTDVSQNINSGKLRCNFCRFEFEPEKIYNEKKDLKNLNGEVIGSGASDIKADSNMITLKCTSCGAEVVIDTNSSTQARCHWCRNTLSINEQVPNGAVPDTILPFSIKKEVAKTEIEKFVNKRKFYANPKFKKEFNTDNIMGVYFPYMLVDVNAHANFSGEGERKTGEYYLGSGEDRELYFDADLYHVEREFDIVIDGLSVEASSDKLNNLSKNKTNNVINAIMPFDIENCVKWDANYLRGYTSEKRDINIDALKNVVNVQSGDIARFAANSTLKKYDRGVAWTKQDINIKGQKWLSAYLPVWLYSYLEQKGNKKILHYVAVNARTKEIMGSIPIHIPKLLFISFIIEILGIVAMFFVDWDYNWIFLLLGILYFYIMYRHYRNFNARHMYEKETKNKISNLREADGFLKSKKRLRNRYIEGVNNTNVNGSFVKDNILENLISPDLFNNKEKK